MEMHDERGRFTKGNPGGGRPKKQPSARDLLKALTPQAVTRLGDLIHSEDDNTALKACIAVLDYFLIYDRDNPKMDNTTRHIFKNTYDDDDDNPVIKGLGRLGIFFK